MALNFDTNPADLCRVCIQNVTYVPSENIFESCSDITIYCKLSAICREVFAAEPQELSSFTDSGVLALPLNVCRDCKSRIDDAYELHKMCVESNRKLRELLLLVGPKLEEGVTVKQEPEEAIQSGEPSHLEEPQQIFAESLNAPAKKSSPRGGKATSRVMKQEANDEEANNQGLKQETNGFPCEKCGVVTKREFALHKHMKMKHPKDVFKCDKCYEVYFDEAKLKEHRKNHDLEKPYPCPNCSKRFKVRRDVTLHANHCKGHTPYLCTECGKSYSYHSSLVQHLLRHKERAFACGQCPVKFHTKGALKMHVRITHNKEKNHSCDICEKRFVTNDSLKKHMVAHTGERRFTCDICNMRFKRSNNKQRHMRTHTGEKPYKCTHCDRAFSQTNDLLKHSKTHFGDNPYKCDRCDDAFRLISQLRDHYKVHYQSGGNQDSEPAGTFQFTIVSALKRRAAQERQREHHQDDIPSASEANEDEMVNSVLANLPEFPMEMENNT
ncbi:AAEL007864-PA [Aedes aegypti]|uniref:AAEL007864-PA n=1 Tax=Aedes aegypti TaxID=7159 RepID=Q170M9_AEDAE|nr:AAEL007864-PA [Aedes aegypti]